MQKYLLLLLLSGAAASAVAQQAPARPAALPVGHQLTARQYDPIGAHLPGPPAPPALGMLPGSRGSARPAVPAGVSAAAAVTSFFLSGSSDWQRYQQQRAFTGRSTDPAGYLTGRPQ